MTFVISPISAGREPVNELKKRLRYSNSSIIVRADRISPKMELLERLSLFKFVSRAISGGMIPLILLENKFRSSKFVRAVICVGKNPISFSERSRLFNLVIDDKKSHVVGNERPERLKSERSNDVKFAKFPKSNGIEPVQLFSVRSRVPK